ncbi:transcriptional regulator, ArsR family protein [Halosimplex carlsbadense 2-9-1]|uniref:Transcriptional regulator, ArsR family protein n=1 Tax=Halosimplex carlsbadense 2-9-1 TaxID=797114 RepID=M0CCY4_9EURY|nr:helix-turn-helix domain-containing protein [Halosimplex carlsbadense]ELZ21136.1 transcriptional regulator, ArsR family protein [Halosimplex carlsbadense 2-9-1]
MTGRSTSIHDTNRAALTDLPPSAKLVAKTLEYEGDLTQSQISESARLPQRTVRFALTKLEDNNIVRSRISFMDARKRVYTLSTEEG